MARAPQPRLARDAHTPWAPETYDALATILRERAGLVFQSLRRDAVETAAQHVMRRVGLGRPELFVPLVAQDGAVFDDLMAEVTIGETYFFREPGHFDLLRERILPEFRVRAEPGRKFRAWSAASSTGEEPYSIAIAVRESGVPSDVIGTDISRARLAAARRATYRRWSFRGVPETMVQRYFKAAGDDYTLDPLIRKDVELRYLNLASDCYPALASGVWGMDVIFCRNVLIYFDGDTIQHVAESLVASLADGGWIMLGATDPPLSDYVDCEVVQTKSGLVYRKPTGKPKNLRSTAQAMRAAPMPAIGPMASMTPAAPVELVHPPRPIAPPSIPVPRPVVAPRLLEAASGIAPALQETPTADADRPAARVRALANAGRLDEAGRACAAALDIHREDPELHYLHAILVGQSGQFAESARAAKRALYLDRQMIVAHIALGAALARSGDPSGARRAYRSATTLLEAMSSDAPVPYSDGAPAGRLLEMTRVQSRLAAS